MLGSLEKGAQNDLDPRRAGHEPIESLDLFRLYEEVATWCWDSVRDWDAFSRHSLGQQLVRAIDSINANLVEGDGRYGSADAIRFFIFARASARESRLWIGRAKARGLLDQTTAEQNLDKLTRATKLLNLLINYRRGKGKVVKDSHALYTADPFSATP